MPLAEPVATPGRQAPAAPASPAGAVTVRPGDSTGPHRRRRSFATSADTGQRVLMLLPALLLLVTFMITPICLAAYLSLTEWNGFTAAEFIGLANYRRLAADPSVLTAARVTILIAVVGTVLCNVLGLTLAMLLNGAGMFKAVLRALVFYPYLIGALVIGFLWSAVLGPDGAMESLVVALGGPEPPFLSDPVWALWSVTLVVVWASFGINVVLYLAGLQSIPETLLEAARVDGASAWRAFRSVTLPLLAPIATLNLVLTLVLLLRVYEIVLAMTNGGPAGRTETLVFLILSSSFNTLRLGYASAQSIVLLVAVGLIATAIILLRSRAERAVEG